MSSRTKTAICTALIASAGIGAFAASGFGDDPPAGADGGDSHFRIVKPGLEATDSNPTLARATANQAGKEKKAKPPRVTNLITTDPVTVAAADEIVAELKCKKSQGIPLTGGAISPPSPAQVAISVLSRFSPNPPFEARAGSYFVGVRNLDPLNSAQFRGTLVCAKGVEE